MESVDGLLVQEYTTSFYNGVWPDWLDLRQDGRWAGSSVAPAINPGGGIALTAATGSEKNAGVFVTEAPDIGNANVARIDLRLTMAGGATTDAGLSLGIANSGLTRGVAFLRPAGAIGSTPSVIRAYNNATIDRPITRLWEQSGARFRFSYGISITKNNEDGVNYRDVGFYLGETEMTRKRFSPTDMPSGAIRGEFNVLGATGGAGGTVHELHQLTYRVHYKN